MNNQKSTENIITNQRMRTLRVKNTAEVIRPWIDSLTERGRTSARTSVSELDVTALFVDIEDKIVALFASLAAPMDSDMLMASEIWNGTTPSEMVYDRIFTDIERHSGINVHKFKKLMDILWSLSRDYGSIYDAFSVLVNDPDPVSALMWMMGDEIPTDVPEHRIPRFLMALMLSDNGIGQGLLPHYAPENITVPLCSEVRKIKSLLCPIRDIEYGEVAHLLGLSCETDIYYLAMGWKEVKEKSPGVAELFKKHYKSLLAVAGKDSSKRAIIRRDLRFVDF